MDEDQSDFIVLINRDQTQPIIEEIFFNSEDHSFFKDLSKGLEGFQSMQIEWGRGKGVF
mgnify:CR=1 FL=1